MSQIAGLTLPISRLAPTPSGLLHIGNAYSFVLTSLITSLHNGQLLLRIDDLDSERTRDEYLSDIFDQIDWLGLQIHKGPSSVEEFRKKYSQHLRLGQYKKFLNSLNAQDFFVCTCSRSQQKDPIYNGTCRNEKRHPTAKNSQLRANTQNQPAIQFKDLYLNHQKFSISEVMGDFVIQRKNGLASYQVASAVDDIEFGVNLIVRGEDLLYSTGAQIFLSQKWGHDLSSIFYLHHPLLSENTDHKLSKSHDSLSLSKMRALGVTSRQIYRFLARSYGFKNQNIECFEDLLEEYATHELRLESVLGIKL